MSKSGIYKITNAANGKIYIGSATNFALRWGMHLFQLRHNTHHSVLLQRSFNKHGEQAFVFSKILVCAKEDLISNEQRYLDELKPYKPDVGYNICETAGNSAGRKMSAKAMALQKKRMIGNTYTLGYKHTEEAKAKMKGRATGNKFSVGKRNWLGKKHTEETKARLSEVARNRPPMSEETKEKIRKAMVADHINNPRTYHPASDETKAKMSRSQKGKHSGLKGVKRHPHSEETKRKMSEARAKWHARKKQESL